MRNRGEPIKHVNLIRKVSLLLQQDWMGGEERGGFFVRLWYVMSAWFFIFCLFENLVVLV